MHLAGDPPYAVEPPRAGHRPATDSTRRPKAPPILRRPLPRSPPPQPRSGPGETISAANLPLEPRRPRPLRRWRQPPALLRSGSSSGWGADDLPDLVRVVSIGRKVEDLLANPQSKEWLSISTELCGGTHISNTRDAAAFALISKEGIAKGVRRITVVTAECASQAMKLASSIDSDINEASKLDGATLEKKIGSIKNTLDAAAIPAARKADLKGNVSKLEERLREAKKKMGKENIQKVVKTAIDAAEVVVSEGKPFYVTHADVGLDTTAVREAVVKAMDRFKMQVAVLRSCWATIHMEEIVSAEATPAMDIMYETNSSFTGYVRMDYGLEGSRRVQSSRKSERLVQ
ncbi:alanine--tRNA ligase-like [Hordeum vulgare subsp. vulgare]|uniref:alanine--tRNA ligase-like n=1 Tax=Hordeum vulgare subsp. vulgare TaxID=112509 RepID=UPI001D1A3F9E|nr:alanine--tRNA ligase-like [Hordeum vulgare subsp. vulgare]